MYFTNVNNNKKFTNRIYNILCKNYIDFQMIFNHENGKGSFTFQEFCTININR